MPLSNRQKCLGGVMLAAAVAFFWDHAHGSPKPTEETLAAPEVIHSDAATVHTAALVTTTPVGERISNRLARVAQDLSIDPLHASDAFALPKSWPLARGGAATSTATTAPTAGPTELEIDHGLADEFVRKHHVDAVMSKNGAGYAIVDGRTIQVGQSLDHFKLASISASSAVFQRHRVQVQIRLHTNSDLHLDGSAIDNQPLSNNDE